MRSRNCKLRFSLKMTNKVAFWGKTSVCSDSKSWVGTLSERCDTLFWNAKQMCLGFDFYVQLFKKALVILLVMEQLLAILYFLAWYNQHVPTTCHNVLQRFWSHMFYFKRRKEFQNTNTFFKVLVKNSINVMLMLVGTTVPTLTQDTGKDSLVPLCRN